MGAESQIFGIHQAVTRQPRRRELSIPEPGALVTPETFVRDGRSSASQRFNTAWDHAKANGELVVISGCGDARFVHNPDNAAVIHNITGAAIPGILQGRSEKHIFSKKFGTKFTVTMTHHDGRKVTPGKIPGGCGGRDEKGELKKEAVIPSPRTELVDAAYFVENEVTSDDPIILAMGSAIETVEKSGTPSLAVSQDHITGKLSVLGAVLPTEDGGIKILHNFPTGIGSLLDGRYDKAELYRHGIPELPWEMIPEMFHGFLRNHEEYIQRLKDTNPDFETGQVIQNPRNILLTTSVRSERGRLPTIAGSSSNDMFTITLPRDPHADASFNDDVDINIETALNQLSYPFLVAQNNQGDPSKPFSDLYSQASTVTFETRDLATSKKLVLEALKRPWFVRWAEKEGHRIIVAETNHGMPETAEYFDLEHAARLINSRLQ